MSLTKNSSISFSHYSRSSSSSSPLFSSNFYNLKKQQKYFYFSPSFNFSNKKYLKNSKKLQRFNNYFHSFLFFQLIIFLVIPIMVNAETENPFPNDFEEHRICGRLLINALKTVCNHQYMQPTRDHLYDNYYKNTGMVLRARRSSSSSSISELFGNGKTRTRRGIIWECCTNKCSLNYIRNNYCATGSNTGDESTWQFVEDVRRRRR
ncbi:IlGF domain-containing protein [Meloidogyne graminicola]|uniref:IlGF domain-containing protein n=1 Tax=Meloidogyne graminicola TaxID=189291 RepID=A0A8T0A486_9BILA|nr:IlGF domain-containing protein [Meloidogyne graminicola]